MATGRKVRVKKIVRRKLELRQSLWPDLHEERLWLRQKSDGWLSIPRAFPLLLRIMDMLAPKGKPVSQTYLDLMCRTNDDAFGIVNKPRERAYYAGFTGERAERTWADRMKILAGLDFIDIKSGASGPINYILLYNPYHVIKRHHQDGKVDEAAYNALKERVIEIGADYLDAPTTSEKEPSVLEKPKKKSR
jgi:hypothetical protein